MSIKYPQEILDQQIKVRQELKKLARMRTDYLKSTGQMPTAKDVAAYLEENGIATEQAPKQKETPPA